MNTEYKNALRRCETDVEAALQRLSGDEDIYERCLDMFLEDRSVADFDLALKQNDWDDAFTAMHALKGVAGNLGFIPLFHSAAEMVILIRSGRTEELGASYIKLKRYYMDILDIIRGNSRNLAANYGRNV